MKQSLFYLDRKPQMSHQVWSRKHEDACDIEAYKRSPRRRIPGDTMSRLREYNEDSAYSFVPSLQNPVRNAGLIPESLFGFR